MTYPSDHQIPCNRSGSPLLALPAQRYTAVEYQIIQTHENLVHARQLTKQPALKHFDEDTLRKAPTTYKALC